MLVATLLDGGLAVLLAGMIALLAAFGAYHLPDARSSAGSIDSLQMISALSLSSLAGIFAVRNADRVNNYATAGFSVGAVTFLALFSFWLLLPSRDGVDILLMLIASSVSAIGTVIIMMGGSYVLGAAFGVATDPAHGARPMTHHFCRTPGKGPRYLSSQRHGWQPR
jgi:hypothetical protein